MWPLQPFGDAVLPGCCQSRAQHGAADTGLSRHPVPGLNTQRRPTDDSRVRQALAAAVTAGLSSMAGHTYLREATGVIPPGLDGFRAMLWVQVSIPCSHASFWPTRGIPMGLDSDPAPLHEQSQLLRTLACSRAEGWRTHLNINVELVVLSWSDYLSLLAACRSATAECDYHVYRMAWLLTMAMQ